MEQKKQKNGRRGRKGLNPMLHNRILELTQGDPSITAPEIQKVLSREFDTSVSTTSINLHRRNPDKYANNYRKEEELASNEAQAQTQLSIEEVVKAVKLYRELKRLGVQI